MTAEEPKPEETGRKDVPANGSPQSPAGSTPGVDAEDFRAQTFEPSRKDRLKPLELLGLSGLMAVFVGLIVLMSTREVVLSLIFLGVAFIVVLVALAMFSLSFKPDDAEIADLDEQNHTAHS